MTSSMVPLLGVGIDDQGSNAQTYLTVQELIKADPTHVLSYVCTLCTLDMMHDSESPTIC